MEAVVTQALNRFQYRCSVVGVGGFRDLELYVIVFQAIALDELLEPLLQLWVEHVRAREVYRNRQRVAVCLLPRGNLFGSLLPYVAIHLANEAVALKEGDEVSWRYHAELGMHPTDEGLRATELGRIVLHVVFGLIEHRKLPFVNRSAQIVEQTLVAKLPLAHVLVVYLKRLLVVAARLVACRPGPIEHEHRPCAFRPQAHAHAQVDVYAVRELADAFLEPIEHSLVVILMFAVNVEVIGFKTTGDAMFIGKEVANLGTDALQHVIAKLVSMKSVDVVELLYVDRDGIQLVVRVILRKPIGILEEEVAGVQQGYLVVLRRRDKLPSLAQLNYPSHARKNYLMQVEGLGNEVGCAQLKRLQFRALLGGKHDYGNLGELLVVTHVFEYLESAHHRHHEVQKDDGKLARMLPHGIKRLLAIGGIDDLVVVLQDDSQDVPVYLVIVHDENQLGTLYLLRLNHVLTLPGMASRACSP